MGAALCALLIRYPSPYSSVWSHKEFCEQTGVPLPSLMHAVMDKEAVAGRHVAVIGDVHGCFNELRDLISQLEDVTQGNCLYIFCGDVINKGPHNKETLDYVRAMGDRAFVIRGNHEDAVVKHYTVWREKAEVTSKYEWLTSLSDDDVAYLRELPYTVSIPHLNAIVVHAGLNPWQPLWMQTPLNMTKMRNIGGLDVSEEIHVNEIGPGYPWASLWTGPTHVYFGHDAKRRLQLYPHATGLDTGCLYGGCLTAKLLTGDQRTVQVPAKDMHVKPGDQRGPANSTSTGERHAEVKPGDQQGTSEQYKYRRKTCM